MAKSKSSNSSPTFSSLLQFSQLLDKLPAGAYTCDANGLITYFNESAVKLWGRAPKLNDSIDRFCGSFKLFSADGKPITHDACWMALALKNRKDYNGHEIIVERPDGIRVTALAHANPLFDEQGRLTGAVNVLVDISDRKLAEQAQSLLASIVESSDDAIISKTLDGHIRSWNKGAERIFGYTADEAIGRPITLIIPEDRQNEEHSILYRLRRGERIEHFETVRRTKDGRFIDISLTISPVCDSSGYIVGASKVARDISPRKRDEAMLLALNEQLRDVDQRKDRFLATLAHELRNPLAPICNSLHLLRMAEGLSPAVETVREIMERQVNHLVRLVDDLLDVSRITSGKIDLHKEVVELAAIIDSAVETSRPGIESMGHQLAISMPREMIVVEADPLRLSQVVANLLNNAARYTNKGGQIWLTVQSGKNEVLISVKDTGLGIPADKLPHVFDMFTQVDQTRSSASGGLGIGLTLAKSLVEIHGGRIEARSPGPGKGSEFVIHLPIEKKVSAPPIPPARQPFAFAKSTPRRILIVDDAQAAARTLSMLLKTQGHDVQTVHDAASALELAASMEPHILISDIAMPKMDGYELARRIRANKALDNVILVALSGYGQESDRQRALEAGFNHYLVKPVSLDALDVILSTVSASHDAAKRHISVGTTAHSPDEILDRSPRPAAD